jgi:4-oxalocrotonate tautomerase
VTIQITREGTTAGQKAALIKGATDLLRDVLGKPPGLTFVVIQEVDLEDWGVDGLPRPSTGAGRRPGQPGKRNPLVFKSTTEKGNALDLPDEP